MILNSLSYRKIKNALAKVPGAPGSAQLGEAIAAGWGFRDYHELKGVIEKIETDLSTLPTVREVETEKMTRRLVASGARDYTAKDLAATMLLIHEGDAAVEWIEQYPDMHGATAYRLDITPDRWRDAVRRAADLLFTHAPDRSWCVSFHDIQASAWRYIDDTTENYASELRVIHTGSMSVCPLDVEEYELTELAVRHGGLLPIQILESTLNMCSDFLPEGARSVTIEPDGVFVRYDLFEICLAHFLRSDTGEGKPGSRITA